MEKSQFSQYIKKFFKGIALLLTQTINGKEAEATYLYKVMLTKKFSASMKWETLNIDGRAVMADVVALDSRFPLKKRSRIQKASGEIPKLGTKRSLNETQMNEIMLLEAMPGENEAEIARIIFDDDKSVTVGIWERLEYQFLQAFSNNGIFEVTKENNIGQHVLRVNLMQPTKNQFGAATKWSDPEAKPIDDIVRVMKAAKQFGHNLAIVHMNDATFSQLANNTQIRRMFAASNGYGQVENAMLPMVLPEQLKALLKNQYKLTVNIIDRAFVFEKNGEDTVLQGWTDNKVVFTASMNVGSLVYTKLAAELRPNKNADYAKVDDYILLSKYQDGDDTPLEYTTSQARVIPVINMHNIYSLDVEEAQDGAQVEGDTTINIYGDNTVVKADAIQALKDLGVSIAVNASDKTVISKINELTAEQEEAFKTAMSIE